MKIVVIGAGLMGVSTAYFLAGEGHQVTVLDRQTDVARETSFANGGILTPSMADPWNAPGVWKQLIRYLGDETSPLLLRPKALPGLIGWGLTFLWHSSPKRFAANAGSNARLCLYNLKVMKAITATETFAFDAGPGGTLKIFQNHEAMAAVRRMADFFSQFGIICEELDAAGSVAREPALAPVQDRITGGLYFAQDGSGDARLFTQGLAQAAKKRGVAFEMGVEVTGADVLGGRVRAVRTSVGDYPAEAVVLAAGSHCDRVARLFGFRVPVRPVKGYSITAPTNGWQEGPKIPIIDDHFHAVVTPLGSRLRVAGTAEFTGYDATLTPSRIDNLKAFLLTAFPGYASYMDDAKIEPWCGFRPMSADGVPLIGGTPLKNVYLNTGHGHLGWSMAAASGKLLANLMMGKKPDMDLTPFDPRRFSSLRGAD